MISVSYSWEYRGKFVCQSFWKINAIVKFLTFNCFIGPSARWFTLYFSTYTITHFWLINNAINQLRNQKLVNISTKRNFENSTLLNCLVLDGVTTNGTSSVNNAASSGSYVPPQTSAGTGSANQTNPLIPEIKIREWVWTAANPYRHPEIVVAVPVGWPVPTVHRLWFGTSMGTSSR